MNGTHVTAKKVALPPTPNAKENQRNYQWMIPSCYQMEIAMTQSRTATRTMMKHGHRQCDLLIQKKAMMKTAKYGNQLQSDQQTLY